MTSSYLKFTDPAITGGCQSPAHQGEIEVLSWSHGFARTTDPGRAVPGSGTVEQAAHQNFSFTKYPDSASSELLKLCWSGKQIGKAVLSCFHPDGHGAISLYLQVELEHVVIGNFCISAGPGDMPVETIALDYAIVTYRYFPRRGEAAGVAIHDRIGRSVS